jgi:hypothetical protein
VRTEASFEAATPGQLASILIRVEQAGTRALDYLTQWVEGEYAPECYERNPIDWLIDWLDIQEAYEKNHGR